MTNPALGAVIMIGGMFGLYLDYIVVRFLFRLGSGIAEWLGGPEIVGTGIGLFLTITLLGAIVGILAFSVFGLYIGYNIIAGRQRGTPRRWARW